MIANYKYFAITKFGIATLRRVTICDLTMDQP
jgi:hypothetical protein